MRNNEEHHSYLKRVQELYDKFAQRYSEMESRQEFIGLAKETLSLIEPLGNKKVLDAGCGPGVHAYLMAEKGAHVVGVDISFRLLEIARERCRNLSNCQFLMADVNSLGSLLKKRFDIVLSSFEAMYHKDLTKLFRIFNTILQGNGRLLLLLPHPVRNMGMHGTYDYFKTGCFKERWAIGMEIEKYYYKLEDYVNALSENGFCIKKLIEPEVPRQKLEMYDLDTRFPEGSRYPQGLTLLMEKNYEYSC